MAAASGADIHRPVSDSRDVPRADVYSINSMRRLTYKQYKRGYLSIMRWYRNASVGVMLIISVLCALVAHAAGAHAADGIQLIRLRSHSFFVPKSWMAGSVTAERATDGGGSQGRWWKPQSEPIDATDLTFVRPDRVPAILQDWTDPLPSLIHISSYRDTPVDLSRPLPETKSGSTLPLHNCRTQMASFAFGQVLPNRESNQHPRNSSTRATSTTWATRS
jgi:hypothetical protein